MQFLHKALIGFSQSRHNIRVSLDYFGTDHKRKKRRNTIRLIVFGNMLSVFEIVLWVGTAHGFTSLWCPDAVTEAGLVNVQVAKVEFQACWITDASKQFQL